MSKIDDQILDINKAICANIGRFDDSERGLLSQNILSQLRNFVEHIALKIYSNGNDIEDSYENITLAIAHVNARGDLRFLNQFHGLLQITASHYTLDEENSERLMLKYYEYLLKIRSFLKKTCNLDVLENIQDFPINIDPVLDEYYQKIVEKVNLPVTERGQSTYTDRYYIQKVKPFFVNYEVYYEVTFTIASDKASKFDRIISFTKLNIPHNYAVKLSVSRDHIEVFGKIMPIQIIDDWEMSVRPCELDHFADIFGKHAKINAGTVEYRNLMVFLKETGLNLSEIVSFSDDYYTRFRERILEGARSTYFLAVLDKCREIIKGNKSGSNVIKYLLYRLSNKIIKLQYNRDACERLSNLNLKYGCIPFDEMPFNTSLIEHNPMLFDIFDCIDSSGREHELFARYIRNNNEIRGQLYTLRKDIVGFENIDDLIQTYNGKLYRTHGNRRLENYKNHIYIKGYEEDAFHIIERLKQLSSKGIKNYSNSFDSWLQSSGYVIDCDEKKEKLRQMFENSEVAIIYGSAGTGKTMLIEHISKFFHDKNKLYLANTYPAVDNLKRRVSAANCSFKTVAKFVSDRNDDVDFDLIIIDECSTVSNSDMLKILEKASFKLLVLVGDVFQIESIRFGNWFGIARNFVPVTSVFELTKPYRSNNPKLLELWSRVRNIDDDVLEHITKNNYSITLDDSIFDSSEEDEIILCLNYDGLYGINNINRFLQGNNPSESKQCSVHTYKVNDPILFNETERFAPLIYNNMKGKIVGIEIFDEHAQFDIELDKTINEFDAIGYDFQLMENSASGKSVIRFLVNKLRSTDEDDESLSTIIPFQVAYAVSIHKAQGLEYNSVKIVITNESEEMITHNIFYTAITRAKEKLKIYWTPETEQKVLSKLQKKQNTKDTHLLSAKYGI